MLHKVYKERAILNNIFPSATIDCACNISELIVKHLMENTFSYKMLQKCSTCEWTNEECIAIIKNEYPTNI